MNLLQKIGKTNRETTSNRRNMAKTPAIMFGLHFMAACTSEPVTNIEEKDAANLMDMSQAQNPDAAKTFTSISITFGGVGGIYSVDSTAALVKFMDFAEQKSVDFFNGTEAQLRRKYATLGDMGQAGKLVIYYRAYPQEANLSKNAIPAIRAALCAKDQGKFWEMHDRLLTDRSWVNASQPTTALLQLSSKIIGIDQTKFSTCYSLGTPENARIMGQDIAEGNINEVNASPTEYLIIPKTKISRDTVEELYSTARKLGEIGLYEDSSNYVISYAGVFPLNAYSIFLDKL